MSAIKQGPDQARRALMHRAALAFAAGVLGVSAVSPAISAAVLRAGSAPAHKRFSPAHRELVAQLAQMILPATCTPGAHQFIETVFSQLGDDHRARFLRGLEEVNARASVEASDGFLRADSASRERIVARLDREAFAGTNPRCTFFREFKELALIGHYTSQGGASRELRYATVPGEFRGSVPPADMGRAWAVK